MDWKVGILCASDDELEPFLPHIEHCVVSQKAMLRLYEGTINGVSVICLYSGVCKVNAAIAAQLLIDIYQVNAVVNAGTAGGLDASLRIFDTVISTQAAYHDVAADILTDFHPWLPSIYFSADETLLRLARKVAMQRPSEGTVFFGRMVTGETFIEDDRREAICEQYAPLSVDMETASIAHVCYVNQIPFLAIRSITDTASHTGSEDFERNCRRASEISKDVVLALLEQLKTYRA